MKIRGEKNLKGKEVKTVEIRAVDLTVATTSPEFVDVLSEGLQSIEPQRLTNQKKCRKNLLDWQGQRTLAIHANLKIVWMKTAFNHPGQPLSSH